MGIDQGRNIGIVTEEMVVTRQGEKRLFDVQLPLRGKEETASVIEGQRGMTILRGPSFEAVTRGGVDDLARTMGPVSGNRIRDAYRISLAEVNRAE